MNIHWLVLMDTCSLVSYCGLFCVNQLSTICNPMTCHIFTNEMIIVYITNPNHSLAGECPGSLKMQRKMSKGTCHSLLVTGHHVLTAWHINICDNSCLDHWPVELLISSWLIMTQQRFRTCFRWSLYWTFDNTSAAVKDHPKLNNPWIQIRWVRWPVWQFHKIRNICLQDG